MACSYLCCEMQNEGILVSQIATRAYLYRASVCSRDPLAVDESSSLDQVFVVHLGQEPSAALPFVAPALTLKALLVTRTEK